MILKVIYRLQVFSNAIRRTFLQHFKRFQLSVCSHGSSALADLLFYSASSYVALLAVVILSVTRVLCDKIKQCIVDILIPHERAITLVF